MGHLLDTHTREIGTYILNRYLINLNLKYRRGGVGCVGPVWALVIIVPAPAFTFLFGTFWGDLGPDVLLLITGGITTWP